MFSTCILFVISSSLVNSTPTNYVEPLSIFPINLNQNGNEIANADKIVQENKIDSLPYGDSAIFPVHYYHDVERLPDSEAVNFILDNLVHTSRMRDGIEGMLPMDYDLINQDKLSVRPDLYPQSFQVSNQVYEDEEPIKITMDIGVNNYDDNDNELPNPVIPFDSFSNIQSTYAQKDVPLFKTPGYDNVDILNPEDLKSQLSNVRVNRSEDDDYARFLEELEHDAMMNNIIPTMTYVRGAEVFENEPLLQAHGSVLPSKISGDCGLNIFLGCKPHISRGVLNN